MPGFEQDRDAYTESTYREPWEPRHNSPARRLLLPAAVVLLGLLVLGVQHEASKQAEAPANEHVASAPLASQGRVWMARGAIQLLPDRQMVSVGKTTDGQKLYDLPTAAQGGGGGGGPAKVGPNEGYQRAYVRVGEDRYQPVILVGVQR